MPIISTLQSGIPLNSTGNALSPGEITIGDANGFFPIYNAAGQLQTGGLYTTVYVGSGSAGVVSTLINGQALTLSIEYNNQNQFRFKLTPTGGYVLNSPFFPVNTEHSLGLSYDTTTGLVNLSVDGLSQTATSAFTTTGTTLPTVSQSIASSLSGARSNPSTFNGYIDQVALFGSAPSASVLNTMTNDPVGANLAFFTAQTSGNPLGHIESQSISYSTLLSGFSNSAGTATTLTSTASTMSGIQIGDIVSDIRTASNVVSTVFSGATVTGISAVVNAGVITQTITLSTATILPVSATTDVLVFQHPLTAPTTSILTASVSTQTVGTATGIQAGDFVSGFDVTPGTTVSSLASTTTLTFSGSVGPSVLTPAASESLTFTHPPATNNVVSQLSSPLNGTNAVNVISTQGIQIGDIAVATGMPSNDHVRGITSAGVVTLENNTPTATLANVGSVTFVHSTYANANVANIIPSNTRTFTINTASLMGMIQVGDIVQDTLQANVADFSNSVVTGYIPSTGAVTVSSATTSATSAGDSLTFTHTTNNVTTGSAAAGSSVLSLNSSSGVMLNDIVVDLTNPTFTFSNTGGYTVSTLGVNAVTMSSAIPATGVLAGDTLMFVHPINTSASAAAATPPQTAGNSNTTVAYQTALGTNLFVYSISGIQTGDLVYGPGIPANDTVASIPTTGTAVGSSVVLTNSTTIQIPANTNLTFVHPNSPDVQLISLTSTGTGTNTYKAGDTIALTAYLNANTPVTRTYTVQSTDLASTLATTTANIAKSFVLANPTIGAYFVANGPNGTIELIPSAGSQQVLPAATITDVNSFGVDENTVSQYYNFYRINSGLTTFVGANPNASASLFDSTGVNTPNTQTSFSYATNSSATTATKQAHGPIFPELVSISGTTVTYNLMIDPTYVNTGTLSSVGFNVNVPTTQATIANILPGPGGTITQVNNSPTTGVVTYQWLSNLGVTDFTKPVAQLILNLASPNTNIVNATMTNLSVNSVNYKDPVQNVPMLVGTDMNSQVYSLSGHFFSQYNPANGTTLPFGNSAAGTPWSFSTSQIPIPTQDFSYTVTGYGTSNFTLVPENQNLVPVTAANPNATLNLDLTGQNFSTTASKLPFSLIINVPSNASNVNFTPGAGVTLTSSTMTTGHFLTVSGTYTAPAGKGVVASSTPILGVLQSTLNNEFNFGGQFSMDTVSINGVTGTGQSLYFGMGESNAAGYYTITNVPAGMLTVNPFSNMAAINPNRISVNDALAVLAVAAGKGIPPGPGMVVGVNTNILPSDFIAADFNQDGQVTAADALGMLNYIVSVNKGNSTPSFTFIPASANATTYTYLPAGSVANATPIGEKVTAVVLPPLASVSTDKNSSNTPLTTGDTTKILDIVGVLPGDVVNY